MPNRFMPSRFMINAQNSEKGLGKKKRKIQKSMGKLQRKSILLHPPISLICAQSIKNSVFPLIKFIPEAIHPDVQDVDFAIVLHPDVILVLDHVVNVAFVLLVKVLLVFGLSAVNRSFGCQSCVSVALLVCHFEQFVLVESGAGGGEVVGEETVAVKGFGEVGFGGGEFVVAFVGAVGEVFDAVIFIGLLIESGLGFFFIFGVVHGGHLEFRLFDVFFLTRDWLLFAQQLILRAIEHGCFWRKINR